jgi:S-DNA-T family DNA segregation ATPase FtsK/SpoIIIE
VGEHSSQYVNELSGLLTIGVAVFTLASFVSYHFGFEAASGGVLGRTLSRVLAGAFGYAVYAIPVALGTLGVRFLRGGLANFSLSRIAAWMLVVVLVSSFLGLADPLGTQGIAGWFGGFSGTVLREWCGPVGAVIGLSIGLLIVFSFIAGTTPVDLVAKFRPRGQTRVVDLVTPAARIVTQPAARPLSGPRSPKGKTSSDDLIIDLRDPSVEQDARRSRGSQRPLPLLRADEYQPPPISLLDAPRRSARTQLDIDLWERRAQILETKLAQFAIEAKVTEVHPGPVITTFEIELAPGIKVSRVTNLQDDLSMTLRSPVRVVAPIPGKSVVGIEVANHQREKVYLREIIESEVFQQASSVLSLALGKDSVGIPRVEDLARMPHLLIAGATGTGKSVALNAMIMSILSKASPRDVRFVMIDLKMTELSLYEGLPHQLVPVVTDTRTAIAVLNNLCREMDRRYLLLKDKGVRNVDAYNALLSTAAQGGEAIVDLTEAHIAEELSEEDRASDELRHEHMAKIVVIIDELADLMMMSGRNVEAPIIRLAQKARACGIHLIVATQRPSVDVITGLIKANFPARISFQVASRIDSRTILDCIGAERLLGEGDMLFLQSGRAVERLHGAYVSEGEIQRFTEFAQKQAQPKYALDLLQMDKTEDSADGTGESEGGNHDELYDQAVRVVTESRIASISYLQRRLRVGYNRAARLIEKMELEGIVSRSENGRPREVLAPPPPEE